jgi:probable F420-dependent oxidoreductase
MKFTVQFPLEHVDRLGASLAVDNVAAFARTAEAAGFRAIAFTEHPAPSREWLVSEAGHVSLDPFAALGFCAAVTERLLLMPYLAVAAYRSPFVLAKAAATVDVLSGGRLVLALGAGYMESEFDALGVSFTDRAALLDDALGALRPIWSGEPLQLRGRGWIAADQQALPGRASQPGPPIWIGGNSSAVRRRVAKFGDGWTPLMIAPGKSAPWVRSRLETAAELAKAVAELHDFMAEAGRGEEAVEVHVKAPASRLSAARFDAAEHLEALGVLGESGATSFVVHPVDESPDAVRELLSRYGEEVIAGLAG